MASLDQQRKERIRKIQILCDAGMNPYPTETHQTHTIADFLSCHNKLEASRENCSLCGRIIGLRKQGQILFLDLTQDEAIVQCVFTSKSMSSLSFELLLVTLDVGDHIECTGTAYTTPRGNYSLTAKTWRMLSKSLRPIPNEHFGLKNEEERHRNRHLDLMLNESSRRLVKQRARFWESARSFLNERNFLEVETPVLESQPVGSKARQFVTHHNAYDIPVYLRISPELWLKRLLVGGFPKVFEIGRVFRNEGISYEHAQDYTVCEFYEAYTDATRGLEMSVELYRHIALETFGTMEFVIRGDRVDLEKDWETHTFYQFLANYYQETIEGMSFAQLAVLLESVDETLVLTGDTTRDMLIEQLWKKSFPSIKQPTIINQTPAFLAPLGKRSKDNPELMDEFKFIMAGGEIGHAFNELNDPIEQRQRFEEQMHKNQNFSLNNDYLEVLEYGLPPVFGFGMSERFFAFLADKPLRETQLFPLMRPRQ